ncbi:hypothetical protein H6P87_00741 [Rickettsia tillamookensis]|uniref:Uncharacterized protein n=1 Tax=Rickettsia tillamookensis TaxID=2761623 RepID=A0A9E6SQG4_9RICK|nr:hypothetical protein [Rickettsia tillamookensis]QQV75193.1 hypothetical protein H6P87_00741 [Rickettsia tillamookensis]
MKFISLVDTKNQNVITIDADNLILRIEINDQVKETRLKPYMASVLYEMFSKHPIPLPYEQITEILKQHHLIISDLMRMHRRLSEIRLFIAQFHPNLDDIILNTRGVGYSLPLRFKNLHQIEPKENIKFKNQEINKAIEVLHGLILDAIDMTSKSKIIYSPLGYIMNREPIKQIIVEKLSIFNECEQIILKEIRTHEAEFISLRIAYLLVKLKTFIGLARISEYPISEAQWLDWFKQEVWLFFDQLKNLIRSVENL